ncbi:MAG: DsbE family thiol:disulfide interchange protein [Steroidobacteraceae bacterium]
MWRALVPISIFAVLVGFFMVGLKRDPTLVPSPLIGKPAPAYSLPKVEDPTIMVSNTDLLGKQHLVNVWATWCGGCRQEHPVLLAIAKQNVVPMVGIDWKDEMPLAQQWLQQLGNPYVATAFDQEGRVAIDFGVYGAPETFLVDERGVVLYKHVGIMTLDIWQQEFLPIINGKTS